MDREQVIKSLLQDLKDAQSFCKDQDNSQLAGRLLDARENLQSLREEIATLDDERSKQSERIDELVRSMRLTPELVRHMGVYWVKGDSDPWCPHCWEHEQRAVHLNPTDILAGRLCVCKRCEHSINLDNATPPKEWRDGFPHSRE